ncbi:MAG: hypothetical protein JSS81_18245 [Acidobacteria bacterium]|nr:hypothetical protein [Acidobacteriota bacterium]
MKKMMFGTMMILFVAAVLMIAGLSRPKGDFAPADDFPREALIYVQINNLPELIETWRKSETRAAYLKSENFDDFGKRHLALKLVERAGEIFDRTSIFPDLDLAANLSENSAALAVYDIGKMEFVFVAPMSEEKILATSLFSRQADFEEIGIDSETRAYSKEIEVDRQRQKQKILFASVAGRLIVATSEKYFLQTIDNLRGKTPRNRLSADPDFISTAARIKPQTATVWLNQKKLNDDWYFRHYWLMGDVKRLANLRAGMIDLDLRADAIVEKRVFLTAKPESGPAVDRRAAAGLGRFVPADAPFYEIETMPAAKLNKSLEDILFGSPEAAPDEKTTRSRHYFSDWETSDSFSYLGGDFNESVDESEDDEMPALADDKDERPDFAGVMANTVPKAGLRIESPARLDDPAFFENRRALVLALGSAGRLDRPELETRIAAAAARRLTAGRPENSFRWGDFSVEGADARKLEFPALGRAIFYAVRGEFLIFSNNEELLTAILNAPAGSESPAGDFAALTVIRPKEAARSFTPVFARIEAIDNFSDGPDYFFTRNIDGLLKLAGGLERIEITKKSEGRLLVEELDYRFAAPAE